MKTKYPSRGDGSGGGEGVGGWAPRARPAAACACEPPSATATHAITAVTTHGVATTTAALYTTLYARRTIRLVEPYVRAASLRERSARRRPSADTVSEPPLADVIGVMYVRCVCAVAHAYVARPHLRDTHARSGRVVRR